MTADPGAKQLADEIERRFTAAGGHAIIPSALTPKSNVVLPAVTLISVLTAVAAGGFYARGLLERIGAIENRLAIVPSTTQVTDAVSTAVARKLRVTLREVQVVCPRNVARGEAVVRCQIIQPPPEE